MANARHEKRRNKKHAYTPRPPFAIVEGARTPLFRRLSPEAAWVLLELYRKFNGYNRGDLSLTFNEVSKTMSGRVFSRAIWELRGFGFIDVNRPGRLERICTIFGFSDRWRQLCAPEAEVRLAKIGALLEEIKKLKREKWEVGRKSEKRQRIAALRRAVFEA